MTEKGLAKGHTDRKYKSAHMSLLLYSFFKVIHFTLLYKFSNIQFEKIASVNL
mgnify:CR=1 FL=1